MHALSSSAIILDTVVKSTLLLVIAWAMALVLKKRSAATQHMVRAFTLAALLLLPISVMVLPAWHIKGLPQYPTRRLLMSQTPKQPVIFERSAVSRKPSPAPAKGSGILAIMSAEPRVRRENHSEQVNPQPVASVTSNTASTTSPIPFETAAARQIAPTASSANAISIFIPKLLLGLWIAGALFFLARWRLNAMRLAALVRRADVLTDSGWNAQVRAISGELGIDRHVALLVSDEIEVPITTGIMFPHIVLSLDYPEWSPIRRSAILNHELAHIKRLDAFTQALANLAASVYWFHPLVWLMVRAMRAERERACDDHVLATGTKASDYAHELLDIVSGLREPELAAALAMARKSQLEGRVLAVLNPALPRGSVSRRGALAVAVLTLCIVLPLSAMRPAQQSSTPAAKSGKAKPSPASTPAAAPRAQDSGTPATRDASPAPETATPPPDNESEPAEMAEAPEATEPPETPEPAEAPEAPEPPATFQSGSVPAVPATPAVPAVPGVPAVPAVPGSDISICGTRAKLHTMNMESKLHTMNMESNNGNKHWTANWSGGNCSLDLHAEGEIKFNAEATEIQSISPGGQFEVNLRQDDTLKQVKITPSASGLQYVYKINGKQQPFEGEAKAWFSQFLLALERSTGFSADARVPALLAKGGPNAVLDEISNLTTFAAFTSASFWSNPSCPRR
jgi:beta-lactamase regulating signal transducer with metallopeptidase domain